MAESWRAKAKRYARGEFTRAELMGAVGILLVDQAIDVATFGALSRLKGKAFQRAVLPLVKRAGVAGVRAAPSLARTAGTIAMRHPYIAGAAVVYVAVKNRDQIKSMLEEGYDIVEPATRPAREFLREEVFTAENIQRGRDRGVIGPVPLPEFIERFRPKPRKPSSFNKAVSKGMKAIKGSTSYGKRGVITNTKKAFALVTKVASAKKKKKKAPKSGIRRKVWNAIGRLL